MLFLQTLVLMAGTIRILYLDEEVISKHGCNSCGGPGTSDKIAELKRRLPECLEEKKFYPFFKTKDMKDKYFATICSEQYYENECYNNLISESKKNLSDTELLTLEKWEKLDKALITYVCDNKEKIANYFEGLDERCWTEGISEAQEKCLKLNESTNKSIIEIPKISCQQYDESEDCILNTVSSKCSKNVTDVITTAIKILRTNTCDAPPKIHKSQVRLRRVTRQLIQSEKLGKIEVHVKNLCEKNGHPTKKLEETIDKMKRCLEEKTMFLVPKHVYIKHLDQCTKDSITLFKTCLPEKYKYIPQLMFDIYDSIISLLYDDFIIIESELTPCLSKLRSKQSTKEYNECTDKITDDMEDGLVDSKTKFCEKFIPLNECFISQIKKECASSAELTRFEHDYMKAVKKPCEEKKEKHILSN